MKGKSSTGPGVAQRLNRTLQTAGLDLRRLASTARQVPWFLTQERSYRLAAEASVTETDFPLGDRYPCLLDHGASAGEATGHYFHQDLFVAQEIFRRAPQRHVDVGSRVDGFVAHVASFRTIEVIDLRPLTSVHEAIIVRQGNLLSLPDDWSNSTDSLSCLHALEHFGLGRYGDPCDPAAWRLGLARLSAIVSTGGTLYLSVPIGRQRIEFNAHRIFSVPYMQAEFRSVSLDIESLSIVDDQGDFHRSVDPTGDDAHRSFDLSFGLGIWILRKV